MPGEITETKKQNTIQDLLSQTNTVRTLEIEVFRCINNIALINYISVFNDAKIIIFR